MIRLQTISGNFVNIRQEGECHGFRVGDLVEERDFKSTKTTSAVVVGFNSCGIWTLNYENTKKFKKKNLVWCIWVKYPPNYPDNWPRLPKIIERPNYPKTTIKSLQNLLEKFINKNS